MSSYLQAAIEGERRPSSGNLAGVGALVRSPISPLQHKTAKRTRMATMAGVASRGGALKARLAAAEATAVEPRGQVRSIVVSFV